MHPACPEFSPADEEDIALSSEEVYPRDPTAVNVGVGPAPEPWPDDPRLDPALLAGGDHRNVLDRYRYWSVEAIVADLDTRRQPVHIAIQNWEHDFNIGSIVRTGNAFNVAGVHILGRHRWNRRGALVTDRYLHVHHHPDVASFAQFCREAQLDVIGVDNLPGSVPLETVELPLHSCLVFGSEGSGLTEELVGACSRLVSITQYGSTRSMNAGAAAAIAMYHWALSHASGQAAGGVSSPAGRTRDGADTQHSSLG
ncbi:SpoU rRNA Methylase family protein [Propionibacterium cyclohexanicum]|uniref:SpoU rRNA Methylase family protein n=1 Tax=Propionibacterium cyclohexanicum TaxID=64702 RepID=A0A1H9SUL1_9ACTN|nr:SpoU rRNA Methylase family protein [Propionibacterium cyclohexanicum]